jgi:DNA-binding transcriptional ArsR family regulator
MPWALREGPLPVGSIAVHFPVSRPAISKHLRILQGAGLVGYHATGRRNIFYLKSTGFHEAKAYLELFWDEALTNFQRVAAEMDRTET